MANRSPALARRPASELLRPDGGVPNTDRIDVTTPTAHEIYFGALRRNVEQRPRFEDAFFTDLWVRYGTSKATCRHRFDDLNRLVEQMLPADRPLEILDVAVSSGVSTVEWMQSLTRAGIAHRVVAGDAVIEAYLFSFGEHARALVDRTGFLMQLDLAGRAISARPPGCLGRLRFLPAILLVRTLVRLFGSALSGSATREEIRRWGITCRPLRLVTPSLLEQPGAEVVEDDILRTSDLTRLFHVVRAANILNRGYFDVETLRRMLRNLRARLRPDGLLVVCRTMPGGRNQATVFRLAGHGAFSAAARLNSGSEIDELVLSLDGPAC